VYDLHHRNVMEHFKNRPEDLLILKICEGESWETLCPFLGQPILNQPFPYTKKQSALLALAR
jgi:Sulfotransferase domain